MLNSDESDYLVKKLDDGSNANRGLKEGWKTAERWSKDSIKKV